MEQRISLVTLGVTDLSRACAFYEALGWRRAVRAAEGVVFFQAGGLGLALYPRADMARDAGIADAGGTGIVLAHNVRDKRDVDAVLAEAEAAGATLLRRGADTDWGGYIGTFADPEGHVWEVAWNPGFPIAADGSITLPA